MEQWLLLVESNCKDVSRLAEFDNWYDNIHIPDILKGSPGFKSATRYVIYKPEPGRGKYFAVYEIETNDLEATIRAHSKNVETCYAAGRNSDLIELVSRKYCKVVK